MPKGLEPTERRPLLVVVHGDRRTAEKYRDALEDFAEGHRCVVLAPLFPAGVPAPGDLLSYKLLQQADVRFDLVLLRMVEEVTARWPVRAERFYLHGFSGGGVFAFRFYCLHAHRLAGVSVGAPSAATRFDTTLPWPAGIADVADRFGVTHRLDAALAVPVHLTVGARDTRLIGRPPQASRVDRTKALHQHLLELGMMATLEVVPDIAHDGFDLLPAATRFLSALIAANQMPG
ncbi:hydrolase [Streptomyces sp. NPDC052236]|uniref:hydrolase n=1 Tax=Streptomyces sp. NPDC052236 TaxID=3365686 RepID=UPI0037D97A30